MRERDTNTAPLALGRRKCSYPFSLLFPFPPSFDLTTDILFMVDLVMTFNVAIISKEKNKLVMDRKIIAITYLKSWFALDLAASVPFDLIIQAVSPDDGLSSSSEGANTASATSLLKGFKLPRLLRLLKIMRIMRLVKMAKIRPEVVWYFQVRSGKYQPPPHTHTHTHIHRPLSDPSLVFVHRSTLATPTFSAFSASSSALSPSSIT